MRFDTPPVLYFLFIVVIFIPFIIIRYRKSHETAALFAATAPSHERKTFLRELKLRILLSDIFFLLFICFFIIALAGPRWGFRLVADHRRGVDVVLAFDLSQSMNVLDMQNRNQDRVSRLDIGREIAQDLTTSLGEVRIGAAIGKGRGILTVPLTYDKETIAAFLDSLDSKIISGSGTNLESLVEAASTAFDDSIHSRRIIIIFSDGEALSGSFQRAVDKANRAGISVSAVGLGSDHGGPVPIIPGSGAPDDFMLGLDGRVIISSRNALALKNGTERSEGIYVDGGRSDAFSVLAAYIDTLSAESRLTGHRREANPRWRLFVLAALSSLTLSRLMGFSQKEAMARVGKRKKSGVLMAGILCIMLFSSCSGARSKLLIMEGNFFKGRSYYTEAISSYLRALIYDDVAPYAEYGLGSAFFALEEELAALERYRNAEISLLHQRADHMELSYRIHYNMGIIYFQQGEYLNAAQAFREALIIDGSRVEAKRNLELSLLTIARSSTPSTTPQEGEEAAAEGQGAGSRSAIFEYLREQEQNRWRSREWGGESEPSGLDY